MDHRPPHPQPGNDFFFQNGAHHGHDGWWYGPLHLLFLLLVIALIVAAAVWLVRRLSPGIAQTTAPAVAPAGAVAASATADPAVTTLRMDQLTPEQLDQYLLGGQWEGKAGAFGYQDGLDWVHVVEGSESNVVGLPLELLAEMVRPYCR